MSYKNQFLRLVIFCALLNAMPLNAQDSTITDKFIANKKGFFVGAAYIYNYSQPSFVYMNGHSLNDRSIKHPGDSVYRFLSRNNSTNSFGCNIGYNKPFSKRMSFSFGLEMNQRRQMIQYLLYEDGRLSEPDPVAVHETTYAISVPLRMNYYIGRFIINVGNNVAALMFTSQRTDHKDGSYKKQGNTIGFNMEVRARESLSFQLLKHKGFYLHVAAEQTSSFYDNYGYNNMFLAGGAYYF